MDLDWTPMPLTQWRALLAAAPGASLPQSWAYARAMRSSRQVMTRPAVIRRAGHALGLVQVQISKLGPLEIVQLHQGPVWLDGAGGESDWADFLKVFTQTFPARFGRLRRIMPDREEGPATRDLMGRFGLKALGEPYETIRLPLAADRETLRKGLKQKWRNALAKAERSGVTVEVDRAGHLRPWFLDGYRRDRSARGYRSAAPGFLDHLICEAAALGDGLILRARMDGQALAGVLVLCHGASATYQAGWTSAQGRTVNAHHRLLWAAIEALKTQGTSLFDLGGIHPKMAEGVTRFKQGLGGRHRVLAGLYA